MGVELLTENETTFLMENWRKNGEEKKKKRPRSDWRKRDAVLKAKVTPVFRDNFSASIRPSKAMRRRMPVTALISVGYSS